MDSRERYLEEELQRRESEASELRRNLGGLRTKFFQLERAFEINLQSQSRLELEYNCMKLESEELRKLNGEATRERTELNSRLMNAISERDHWKNTFLRQREFTERTTIEHENEIALVKQECNDILKMTREATEKQFQEVVEMYNKTKEQVTRLEERIEAYRAAEQEQENRAFELANLLETLKRFDVDVDSVCQHAADALKSLTDRGNLFEESAKNLRHLAWTVKDKKVDPQQDLLREQNSVLRQVVKSLKRKILQETRNQIPEREVLRSNDHVPCEIEEISRNSKNEQSKAVLIPENVITSTESSINSITSIKNNNYIMKKCGELDEHVTHDTSPAHEYDNRSKISNDIETKIIDKCARVMCIESHLNGIIYEEYVFNLSFDREIKIKYPVLLNNNEEKVIKMDFIDNEVDYDKTTLDRMLILFKNIHAVVHVKQTGIPCSTQTSKVKMSNHFAQTTLTGINSFSRLNVGATMLNSEKRAIERSLCNLERTVKALKFNTLNQAEEMISRDSQLLRNDELLNCIKVLTQ